MLKSNKIYIKYIYKVILVTVVLLINSSINLYAQDPIFTQFYSNPVYLNPAFAGSNKCPRIVSNFRNQWPGFSGDFITTSLTYDQYVDKIKGGLGIILMSDQVAKTLKSNEASFVYSYHQHLSRKFTLNFGIQGTYISKSVDRSNLTFGDMIHPRRGFVLSTQDVINYAPVDIFDFSAGILGYTDKFYVGFATHHLTEPSFSYISTNNTSFLNRRYTVYYNFENANHSS